MEKCIFELPALDYALSCSVGLQSAPLFQFSIMLLYTNFVLLGFWIFVKITALSADKLQIISFDAGEDRNSEGLRIT